MGTIKSHRDLQAWQVAMELTTETYRVTEAFPSKEMYGLQSQMRRAAVSVPSNIAEGQSRPAGAAVNQLSSSLGSMAALETQLEGAMRLGYLTPQSVVNLRQLIESTAKLTAGLRRSKRDQLGAGSVRSVGALLIAFYVLSRFLI